MRQVGAAWQEIADRLMLFEFDEIKRKAVYYL